MLRRFQISFLPLFFTILIAALLIAVGFRISSYRSAAAPAGREASAGTPDGSTQLRVPATASNSQPAAADNTVAATSASSSTSEASESHRIREQRYRQLLQTPPPPSAAGAASGNAARKGGGSLAGTAPAAKAPAQNPSLLSRIVAPIAKVFGGGSSAPKTPQGSSGPTVTREPVKDPNSDVTPPQLLSAVFDPPTVQDGEQTTLIVVASDDLSGVRSIAGNVISPSGALQGFALTRQADAMRYAGGILVPKNAAEGVWRVNYLNLTDNANNSTTLSFNQGTLPATASFRVVSSNADSTPPTLRAVWLDRPSMKGGEKNTLFVQADDDKSGVNLVSGVFLSPGKLARIGFGCRPPDSGNTFTCDFAPPVNADCGDWQLEQVQLQDKANNMISVRRDNPLVAAIHVTVMSDQCDSHPPVVEAITLDRYATTAPGTLVVRVTVTDDISGVGSVSGHFVYTGAVTPGNQPPRLWFACSMTDQQTWSAPVAVPDKAAIGAWRLEQIQVIDKSNNLKIYSAADPLVANVIFRVQ
jgi:hypothetical protein